MAIIKSYTNISQSKVLAKILPLESADMSYSYNFDSEIYEICTISYKSWIIPKYAQPDDGFGQVIPCWSLAALLNILHSKEKNISSLSGGGYKDGKYISDWCLDYEFENGDYQKTFADNPVDACYELILKLNELNLL